MHMDMVKLIYYLSQINIIVGPFISMLLCFRMVDVARKESKENEEMSGGEMCLKRKERKLGKENVENWNKQQGARWLGPSVMLFWLV